MHQEKSTSTNRRPPRQNGWLKMTLATGGIALTIIGTGVLARNEAGAGNTAVNTTETGVTGSVGTAVDPLPTLIVPNLSSQNTTIIPDEGNDTSSNQLVIPSITSRTMPQMSARSRSSR